MKDPTSPRAATPHRSKAVAGALALYLGWTGAHRLYLGWRFWWLYAVIAIPTMTLALTSGGDEWFREPTFFIAALVAVISMAEAIVICLTPDQKWDAKYNAHSGVNSENGWLVVLIAIAALMIGATLMMSVLAISLEAYVAATRNRVS